MTSIASPSSNSPFRVALTGGIASGKSAVADFFAKLGVPVLDTDQIARDVVEPASPTLARLVETFGDEILDSTGKLNRKAMRDRVFSNPEERARLEAIMHPAIRAELARRSTEAGGPYQIHVIPLLTETSRAGDYDRVLVVDCPEEDQIRRLMKRDGSTREQAEAILAAQAKREQRLAIADDVISNTGTLEELRSFVETLHRNYLLIAEKFSAKMPPP